LDIAWFASKAGPNARVFNLSFDDPVVDDPQNAVHAYPHPALASFLLNRNRAICHGSASESQ
jgi:hypothetical protein